MAKSINKQAELRRKMELAKQQKQQQQSSENTNENEAGDSPKQQSPKLFSEKEIKEQNDRKRFEQLLKTSQASAVWNDYASSDGYLNHKQVQQELDAQRKGVDRLFEGDPAPTDCFNTLVDIVTGQPVDEKTAQQLFSNSDNPNDYLLVLCDPRVESDDLRQAAVELYQDLSPADRGRLVVINADSPAENRRWLKKNPQSSLRVYSDPDRQWMEAYSALGSDRWSMTLFLLAHGKVQKLIRDLNVYTAPQATRKLLSAFHKEPRL